MYFLMCEGLKLRTKMVTNLSHSRGKKTKETLILSADLGGRKVLMLSEGGLGVGGRLSALPICSQPQRLS